MEKGHFCLRYSSYTHINGNPYTGIAKQKIMLYIGIPVSRNIRDLTILGRRRPKQKFLQINGSKDSASYIINRMNLIQS